jgi:nitrate reductase NapE component
MFRMAFFLYKYGVTHLTSGPSKADNGKICLFPILKICLFPILREYTVTEISYVVSVVVALHLPISGV